jgi:hypothetical protein
VVVVFSRYAIDLSITECEMKQYHIQFLALQLNKAIITGLSYIYIAQA